MGQHCMSAFAQVERILVAARLLQCGSVVSTWGSVKHVHGIHLRPALPATVAECVCVGVMPAA